MKKIIGLAVCLFALSACGSAEKSVTCKMPENEQGAVSFVLKYDKENKGTRFQMNTEMKADKKVLEDQNQIKALKETTTKQAKEIGGAEINIAVDLEKSTLKITYDIDLAKYDKKKDMLSIMSAMSKDKKTIEVKNFIKESKATGMECGKAK